MKDLSDEATLCLIALVEEFPQLWCLQNDQYRNNSIKSELWKKIANEMERRYSQYGPYKGEGVRGFIQNRRCIFRREKEKIMKTKSGQAAEYTYNGRWRFYRCLLFLDRSKPVLSRECNVSYQHKAPSGWSHWGQKKRTPILRREPPCRIWAHSHPWAPHPSPTATPGGSTAATAHQVYSDQRCGVAGPDQGGPSPALKWMLVSQHPPWAWDPVPLAPPLWV
ncbi:uncharacterized protein ISCGN_024313 [Ixodes scapularis]